MLLWVFAIMGCINIALSYKTLLVSTNPAGMCPVLKTAAQNSSGLVESSPGEISRKHGNKLEQIWYTLRQKSEGNFKIFK